MSRSLSREKKEHPDEQYYCTVCGAENYGYAYWCIKCSSFPTKEAIKEMPHENDTHSKIVC